MKRSNKGFTLVEVMVTVAIIGIITAIALPQYRGYVMRARVTEAFSALGGLQPSLEQYWSNNRTYVDFDKAADKRMPASTVNFSYALTNPTTTSFTLTATGQGKMAGFVYTLNQTGDRATTSVPTGWTLTATCWVDRSGGECAQ
jgi:type IV pilus assembly protein PilE